MIETVVHYNWFWIYFLLLTLLPSTGHPKKEPLLWSKCSWDNIILTFILCWCLPQWTTRICLPQWTTRWCLPQRTTRICLPQQTTRICLPQWTTRWCLPQWTTRRCLPQRTTRICLPQWTARICTLCKFDIKPVKV